MKKILLIGILSALVLFPAAVFADIPAETGAGTLITADGMACYLNYTDSGLGAKPSVDATTITIAVLPIYGIDPITQLANQITTPGVFKQYNWVITNEGNATDIFAVMANIAYTNTTGTGWLIQLCRASDNAVLSSGTAVTTLTWATSEPQAEAARWGFYLKVTPDSSVTNSPNGSYATVTVAASTDSKPVGVYLGANGFTYGGTNESFDTTITSIETSVMHMSRTATVDAPTTANGKYTGGAHDAVPGAVITYTITTSNDGGDVADNVILVDKVPANTWICHVGASLGNQSTVPNVTITAPTPNATGWTAYYTTQAAPSFTFGVVTNWTTIGVVGVSTPIDLHTSSTVTYVKWEKPIVTTTEQAKTLTWGVTIR